MACDLERRLAALAQEQSLAPFARKLGRTLARIRRDFEGAARERLEGVVADTLQRQLVLQQNRLRADAALVRLGDQQEELMQTLYGIVLRLTPDDGATRH